MGNERTEAGPFPAPAEGGGVLVGHPRPGPASRVGDEDLCRVGPAETAFLDGAGDPAGTASDVRPDPHTRYRLIVSPYVTVAPIPGLWLYTIVPEVFGMEEKAKTRPHSSASA